MINQLVGDLIRTSQNNIAIANPEDIDSVRNQQAPLISFSPEMQSLNLELKHFLRSNLYSHYRVYRMTNKSKNIIQSLFSAFIEDIKLLPHDYGQKAKALEQQEGQTGRARVVADYIAGMTDRYAITEYHRMFDPLQLT